MSLKIVEIFESATSDGYTSKGKGKFYPTFTEAESAGKAEDGGWSSRPETHKAIEDGNGSFYLLTKPNPVHLQNSKGLVEEEKLSALKKLSEREKELLGLK